MGADFPQWQPSEPRRVNLDRWRVPDLVGEISDTTLATDLDEKKHLYAALGIPEYWAVDVAAYRLFAFRLSPKGVYQTCEESGALAGLAIALINQTLERLKTESNGSAALWLNRQLTPNREP